MAELMEEKAAGSRVKIDKEKIKAAIEKSGFTKSQLSKELGYSDTYINSLLTSRSPGTMEEKDEKLLCYMLGVKPGTFIAPEPQMETQRDGGAAALENIFDKLCGLEKKTEKMADNLEAVWKKYNTAVLQLERVRMAIDQINTTEHDRAKAFLKGILKDGRVNAPEVLRAADDAGIKRAMIMQIRKEIGVEIDVTGNGKNQKSFWYIPR